MEKKIKDLLKEIEGIKRLEIRPLIIPEDYMTILNSTSNLNNLNKIILEEIIRNKDFSNNEKKCTKCNRIATYKVKENDILLCWNHSI